MRLSDYVEKFYKNKQDAYISIAKSVGCTRNAITKWARCERFPQGQYWQAISDATGGKVTVYDLVAEMDEIQKAQTNQAAQD